MQPVLVEELINYKILPFNIYTKGDKLLFPAGEVLTPGKFLQLRHIKVIYRMEEGEEAELAVKQAKRPKKPKAPSSAKEKQKKEAKKQSDAEAEAKRAALEKQKEAEREFQQRYFIQKQIDSIDNIDVRNIILPVNKLSKISPQDQIKLKVYYDQMINNTDNASTNDILSKFKTLRNKIQDDYASLIETATHSSQLRLVGEYDRCHAINTAMLTAALARKMGKNESFVADVTLAALVHDIGKLCLPKDLNFKQSMTPQEQKLYQSHPKIGYTIIKNKMNLNERIARVALEHHEKNDGTGFPYGKSGEFISLESQIVSVCNYFDNLAFNKTSHKISNGKEALRVMIEMGSKYFAVDVLYSFIYMYNYDDTATFDEMTIE